MIRPREMMRRWFTQGARSTRPSVVLDLECLESRLIPYTTSGNAWPSATLVTISFMPDGTSVNGASSNLFAKFNAKFGSPAVWQNQILRAAQQWAQQTNLNFAVVPDNGAALGSGSYQQGDPGFGDIRIGGYSFGSSCLAQAYLPPPVNNYSIAGDFQFNTGQTFNVGSTYDLFTVALHEFGHSLGLYHSSGTTRTAMSGGYSSAMTGLTVDDVNGIRNIYAAGQVRANDAFDAAASNGASSSATTITSILNNSAEAGVINNLDLTTTTDVDWYKLVVPAGAGSTLKVKVQSKGLSLLAPSVAIYNSALQLESSVSGNNVYGATLTASTTGIVPGETYYIKVSSSDPSAAFRTGRYALVVNAGTGADPAPALPNTKKASGTPASAGGGQAVAIDYEALVNSNDSGAQQTSATSGKSVAVDLAGNYVVTWAGQDGSGWGIYAQRFNKHGARVGGEFRVNSATSGDQVDPSVAMDDLGNFTIVWSSGGDIYARRYTLLGLSLLGQYRVNSTTGGVQSKPAVAMDSLGNSVITWTSGDGSGQGVYARLYTVLGLPLSGEFRVNATTAGDQTDPAVAMNGLTGNFTIAWSSVGQDGSGSDIYARSYSLLGLVRTPEFRVNTTTAGDQARPSVASERLSGNEVIAWQSQQEGNDWDIHAQLYGAGAEGSEFRVNTTTAGAQTEPALAMDAGGNFLVTWTSFGAATGLDVMSQLFSASGDPREAEFGINNTLEGDQQHATPAIGLLGQAIVVWSGNGNGDDSGVFARRYDMTRETLEAEEHQHEEIVPLSEAGANETLDAAQDVGGLHEAVLQGRIETGTDVDWYSFTLDQAAQVTLAAPDAGVVLGLYNRDPWAFSDPDNATGHRLIAQEAGSIAQTLAAGSYWVAVSGAGNRHFHPFLAGSGIPGSAADYQLSLTADTIAVAVDDGPRVLSTSAGGNMPLVVRVAFDAPLDLGTIDPSSNAQLLLNSDDGALALPLAWYNFSAEANELQLAPMAPLAPGLYTIRLAGNQASGQANGLPVLLGMDGKPLGLDDLNPDGRDIELTFRVDSSDVGEVPTTAHDLGTLGASLQVTGVIGDDAAYHPEHADPVLANPAAEVDLYRFDIAGPGQYAFAADAFAGRIGSRLDPSLSLYRLDDAGQVQLIDSNDNTLNTALTTNELLPLYTDAVLYAGLTAGQYYLAVSSGGFSMGAYALNLSLRPDDEAPQVVTVTPGASTLDAAPTEVIVRFSEQVNVQQLAHEAYQQTTQATIGPVWVSGPDGANYFPRFDSYDAQTQQARFLMLDRLPAGSYALHLSGPLGLADFADNPLVGNDPSGAHVVPFTVAAAQTASALPNDTLQQAQPLGALFPRELEQGVTIGRDVTPGALDEADYFQFDVLQSRSYVFELGSDQLSLANIALFDVQGQAVELTIPDNAAGAQGTLVAGTYTLRLAGWSAEQAADVAYRVRIVLGQSEENPPPLTMGAAPASVTNLIRAAATITTPPAPPAHEFLLSSEELPAAAPASPRTAVATASPAIVVAAPVAAMAATPAVSAASGGAGVALAGPVQQSVATPLGLPARAAAARPVALASTETSASTPSIAAPASSTPPIPLPAGLAQYGTGPRGGWDWSLDGVTLGRVSTATLDLVLADELLPPGIAAAPAPAAALALSAPPAVAAATPSAVAASTPPTVIAGTASVLAEAVRPDHASMAVVLEQLAASPVQALAVGAEVSPVAKTEFAKVTEEASTPRRSMAFFATLIVAMVSGTRLWRLRSADLSEDERKRRIPELA